VLAETEGQPAQTACDRIFERLAVHRALAPQQDDITLVAVKAGV
jgi:serine phosphatase RsbU (regulator of sigma subunit)